MQLVYAGYLHDVNSVSITSWSRSYVLSENQWPKFLKVSASFRAKLVGANLFARAELMRQAYSTNGGNLTMLDNDSLSTVIWSINSSQAVGGLLVTSPVSWADVKESQGATYLYCTFSVEAMFPLISGGRILSFNESVTFDNIDGGPIQVERLPAVGKPIIQNVTENSFFYATQEGNLTMGTENPQPMAPIWPDLQRRQPGSNRWSKFSPKTIRGVPHEYGVRWQYSFVSADPINGFPNVR